MMQRRHSSGAALALAALLIVGCQLTGAATAPTATAPAATVPATAPTATAPATAGSTVEPAADLRTKMTKWDLWSSGKTMLRGMNIHQRLIYKGWDDPAYYGDGPVGPVFTQEDFNQLAGLGANYVNVSHPGLFTVDAPYELDEGSQANLDRLLEMIARADMFAVISFRTGPGRSELTFWGVSPDDEMGRSLLNDSVWEDQAAQDAWVEMWRYTAECYRDNPVVVGYDLMVEPNSNGVFFDIWEPPDFYPAYAGTTYDWNRFYPPIAGAIRDVDPDTPILVGALSFSAAAWLPYLEPTGDPRTVYTVHQYAPMDYTHQQPDDRGRLANTYPGEMDLNWDGEPDSFDRDWLESALAPLDEFRKTRGMPVAVNEYGVTRYEPGAAAYLNDLMGLLENRGLNHALWSWAPAHVLDYGDTQEFEYRLGPDIDNRTREVPNDLIDVIMRYWAKNTVRPAQVTFISANGP